MTADGNHVADTTLEDFRERITKVDREIVAAINTRIELVQELHRYKGTKGIPVRDLERERRLVELLAATNDGPLSEQGLQELVEFVLQLVREEGSRG